MRNRSSSGHVSCGDLLSRVASDSGPTFRTVTSFPEIRWCKSFHALTAAVLCTIDGATWRCPMRRAATMHNLLIAILLATHATAYAAEGPFIPFDLGTLGGSQSFAYDLNTGGQVVGG